MTAGRRSVDETPLEVRCQPNLSPGPLITGRKEGRGAEGGKRAKGAFRAG